MAAGLPVSPLAASRRPARLRSWLLLPLLLGLFGPPAAAAEQLRIVYQAADAAAWTHLLPRLAEEVRLRSGGRVEIAWSAAPAGEQAATALGRMRRGEIDGALLSSAALGQTIPALQRFALPLAFQSIEELDLVRADLEQPYRQALGAAGLEGFGWIEAGFRPAAGASPDWRCAFSTLVISTARLEALAPANREQLFATLLRASSFVDRLNRLANLAAREAPPQQRLAGLSGLAPQIAGQPR
ncbi:hypothetical protein DESUT3_38870 [Desulfuromonas versatilis]|uniref:Uncharacterized protein n=1 Tax=Desulfuromonas versatilis TaxID=2802975 RepID=A0ABM8I0F2_9BACT|nr:TRAP transporter substrate-binding protein DctP [Desulfuromonas versatilis]BCR06818.1 hypothetical protein DESUT3_38870 [Desulfuromonas versatilis]